MHEPAPSIVPPAVRFALVGCGLIAKKHLVSLERIDGAELVAVADVDKDAARRLGEANDVPWYTSPRQMAQEVECDAFSILTPSGLHANSLFDLMEFGRHFVVEKPLALRIQDADRIIEMATKAGVQVYVVKQNRYNRPIQALRDALDRGRFGKLVLGTVRLRWTRRQDYYDAKTWRGTWAHDGGVLTNQASHHIDALAWLMGPVESVTAQVSTRLAKIEAEDVAVATLRFANGALGLIEATTATRPSDLEGSLSILGEKGSVEIGGFFMNELRLWRFEKETPEDATVFSQWGKNSTEWAWNHTQYLQDVVANISCGDGSPVDALEGRKSLELISALYESAETDRTVHLRFRPQHCRLGELSD